MNKTKTVIGIAPQESGNATLVGAIVDLADTEKHVLVVTVGAHTDGTVQPKIEHGDEANLSDAADVSEADQIRGNLYNTAIVVSGANRIYRFELLSKFKRYHRAEVIIAGASADMGISAHWETMRLKTSLDNDQNVA